MPFYDYRFLLPQQSLKDGLGRLGAARRLRKFVQGLLDGNKQLKVGIVGGSISFGTGSSRPGTTDWFSMVVTWLASVTRAPIIHRNGCKPATPAAYMVYCLEQSVDPDVDLVFVEYSFNDGYEDTISNNSIVMANEQLVRRLLKLPRQPAVVFMQVPHVWSTFVYPFYRTM
ncbi:hypothetical protein PLESTF_001136900 [Pleodorina starrii]|nr:hypothetical protein PLESTF_001136900 [Pleodorina starrii]